MIDECGVDPGAGGVVDAEVVQLGVPAEEVAFLLVDHQLLDQLGLLEDVQVEAAGRFARPETWILCYMAGYHVIPFFV